MCVGGGRERKGVRKVSHFVWMTPCINEEWTLTWLPLHRRHVWQQTGQRSVSAEWRSCWLHVASPKVKSKLYGNCTKKLDYCTNAEKDFPKWNGLAFKADRHEIPCWNLGWTEESWLSFRTPSHQWWSRQCSIQSYPRWREIQFNLIIDPKCK